MILVITIPFNSQIIPLSCLIIISYKLTTNVDSYHSELVDYTYRYTSTQCSLFLTTRELSVNRKDLKASTLAGPTRLYQGLGPPSYISTTSLISCQHCREFLSDKFYVSQFFLRNQPNLSNIVMPFCSILCQ